MFVYICFTSLFILVDIAQESEERDLYLSGSLSPLSSFLLMLPVYCPGEEKAERYWCFVWISFTSLFIFIDVTYVLSRWRKVQRYLCLSGSLSFLCSFWIDITCVLSRWTKVQRYLCLSGPLSLLCSFWIDVASVLPRWTKVQRCLCLSRSLSLLCSF